VLEIGRGRILRELGRQSGPEQGGIAILSLGTRLAEALRAADMLAARGLAPTVVDARFAKPLDTALIDQLARNHAVLITIEEGAQGGFGAFVMHHLAKTGLLDKVRVRSMTLPDSFIDHNTPDAQYDEAQLNADHIVHNALNALGITGQSHAATTLVQGLKKA
jgi:1-deoxy-D-xylulose-5-phosphate synthase